MNPLAMIKTIRPLLAAALLLGSLAACSSPADPPPLEGAAIGGPFTLVNAANQPVTWDDFAGKYRIVYFGYAYCPDVCPFDVQRMMQGFDRFVDANPDMADDVQPIFITVDPQRDTPAVVGEFTSAFSDKLIGLTGSQAQVDAAIKSFAVYANKGEVNAEGGYLMDHSRAAYLMGRDGQPIALLPVEAADKGEAVAAEIEKWVS
jgi:protein SCO1/2